MKTKARPLPSFSTTVTADVDLDPEDLHDEGWHHESECGVDTDDADDVRALPVEDIRALGSAVASLHRQAHPSAPGIRLCHEEPCRSLTLDQLDQVSR